MAVMQLFLLTLGLTLLPVVQAGYINQGECATTDKLLGNWYIIRWAGNLPLPEEKLRSPLPPFTLSKNRIGYLEFRMNISKPIGCVEFKMALNEEKNKPCYFSVWMWHYVGIVLLRGDNFGYAYLNAKVNNVEQKMVMFMGRQNHTANPTMLVDFETLVSQLSLNNTSIINPPYDDSCELGKES
ncbi:AABR07051348.2 [Phodopus roborovskii]|uniref:AABR07051348.2 protein n=1 Tax=Phodopus roborovskii TaxID=109678 RepID=A0AAU9Z9R5_PHORO|nr:AABR07051348.2 [Phodopus roborovskii]